MEHQGSMPSKDLYEDLPQKIKLYLKTARGLKDFVGFYPALFDEKNELNSSSDDQIIELNTVPIFKTEKDLKLPHGSDPKKGWYFCKYVLLTYLKFKYSEKATKFILDNKLKWIIETHGNWK